MAINDFTTGKLDVQDPSGHLRQKVDNWTNAVLTFSPTFHKNKIYFSRELSTLLNDLNNEMEVFNKAAHLFLTSFQFVDDQVRAITSNDPRFVQLKTDFARIFAQKIIPMQENLEHEFRNVLGVNIKQTDKK